MLAAVAVSLALTPSAEVAFAEDPSAKEEAQGSAPGAEVPSFFVRQAVTDKPNAAVCLVCRYGSRPVVMICARGLDDATAELITEIDRFVDGHRAQGLRGMAVFLDADQKQLQPELARLIRKQNLALPMAFPVEASGPRAMELPRDAQVTVLLYRNRAIQERLIFKAGELTKESLPKVLPGVLAALEKLSQ